MIDHTLIIAYGNPLRGDDGIGPALGAIVHQWRLPGVAVRVVQQLMPELVDELKCVWRVLFIDATLSGAIDKAFACTDVVPQRSRTALGHHETPASLLALAHDLEHHTPEAWLLSIAGSSFDHAEQLSLSAQKNMHEAAVWLQFWLTEHACTTPLSDG